MARDYSKTDYSYLIERNKSLKQKLLVSKALKGRKRIDMLGNKLRKGLIPSNAIKKGERRGFSTEFKKGYTPYNKKHPEVSLRGEKHPNWIKDRSLLKKSEKKHLDGRYREWMKAVKNRDGWKCKLLSIDCKGRLESHHIFNWKEYPELRYIKTNGITLCAHHHPRGRDEEKRMIPILQELLSVSKE